MTYRLALATGLAGALMAPAIAAQFGPDEGPEKIKRIVNEVADEMREIDRLLLATGADRKSAGAARKAMSRNVERVDELLEQTTRSQGSVVQGIDDLIKEIEKMRAQGC